MVHKFLIYTPLYKPINTIYYATPLYYIPLYLIRLIEFLNSTPLYKPLITELLEMEALIYQSDLSVLEMDPFHFCIQSTQPATLV